MNVLHVKKSKIQNEPETQNLNKSVVHNIIAERHSTISVPKEKIRLKKSKTLNLKNKNNIGSNNFRYDAKGNIIESDNKKSYHVHFKDEFRGQKLVEFINIPNKDANEYMIDEPYDNTKKEYVGCGCILF
jgi:hypothetical protein